MSFEYEDIMARHQADKDRWASMGEQELLKQMFDAYQGLKSLGWHDGHYAPRKEGVRYQIAQVGSTGKFMCSWNQNAYSRDNGLFMVEDGGDLYPTSNSPTLWKPIEEKP
jgi:hypothetical protein